MPWQIRDWLLLMWQTSHCLLRAFALSFGVVPIGLSPGEITHIGKHGPEDRQTVDGQE